MLGAYGRDGGMFLPATLPRLTPDRLREWRSLTFQQLTLEVMSMFIEEGEIPREELSAIITRAFGQFTCRSADGGGDSHVCEMSLTPIDSLADDGGAASDGSQRPITVAELWHGPTLAFKDLPLQFLGGLIGFFLRRRREKINVLVGTSGDTGSAAIEAVRHSEYVNIFVLYPGGGRITSVQELQMTTVRSELGNVHAIACDGSSDELDVPILECFEKERKFKEEYRLCSINSVNIIRILMQTVHFIYSYLRVTSADQIGVEVDFSLPTGAAGHIAAGVLAKQMGLPIGQILAATNENDLLAVFLTTGRFYPRSAAIQTSSPAIDIQVPYNIERVLYLLSPGAAAVRGRAVRSYLNSLAGPKGGFELHPQQLLAWQSFGITGAAINHAEVIDTIRRTWHERGYMVDPHTAVAVAGARRLSPRSIHTDARVIVFATAHPAKFIPTVRQATGLTDAQLRRLFASSPYDSVRRVTDLHLQPSASMRFERGDDWTAKLRQVITHANAAQEKETTHRRKITAKL